MAQARVGRRRTGEARARGGGVAPETPPFGPPGASLRGSGAGALGGSGARAERRARGERPQSPRGGGAARRTGAMLLTSPGHRAPGPVLGGAPGAGGVERWAPARSSGGASPPHSLLAAARPPRERAAPAGAGRGARWDAAAWDSSGLAGGAVRGESSREPSGAPLGRAGRSLLMGESLGGGAVARGGAVGAEAGSGAEERSRARGAEERAAEIRAILAASVRKGA
jgi:hypothetical protein